MFARIVLLSIASLMLTQIGFQCFYAAGLPGLSHRLSFDSARAAPAAWQYDSEPGSFANVGPSHGIAPQLSIHPHFVDPGAGIAPHLRDAVWATKPAAEWNPADAHDGDNAWPDARFVAQLAAACALLAGALFALRSWWLRQVRHDLLQLNAMLHGAGASGPQKLHDLTHALGELVCRRRCVAEDQSSSFTAFVKLVEARAVRLRTIAANVARWNLRVALIEDIDIFQDVARQFVHAAGHDGGEPAPVSVDAYLKDRFLYGVNADDKRIVLRLEAGAAFELPRAALVRLIDNLVGNALVHGAPPVEIATVRGARCWTLSVRDHGAGGAALLQDNARTAPQRASHAASRGLGAHWGLGLSIVGRLAQRCNAKLKIGDHPEGGLCVRVIVPANDALPR